MTGPTIVDTTIPEDQANYAHGAVYGLDWIWHDDRLGFLLTKPVQTVSEVVEYLTRPTMRDRRNPKACNPPPGPEIAA